jgi:hypothetical protein
MAHGNGAMGTGRRTILQTPEGGKFGGRQKQMMSF